jgi:hypothetical protein
MILRAIRAVLPNKSLELTSGLSDRGGSLRSLPLCYEFARSSTWALGSHEDRERARAIKVHTLPMGPICHHRTTWKY